jgi:hypothetical protein
VTLVEQNEVKIASSNNPRITIIIILIIIILITISIIIIIIIIIIILIIIIIVIITIIIDVNEDQALRLNASHKKRTIGMKMGLSRPNAKDRHADTKVFRTALIWYEL